MYQSQRGCIWRMKGCNTNKASKVMEQSSLEKLNIVREIGDRLGALGDQSL